MSGFYKSVSGISLFISMAILIRYLGKSDFGVWVLIFTLFQWILLMDFGLASVLKTKIPELKHQKNSNLINAYIKSTYLSCVIIAFVVFFMLSIAVWFFDLKNALNIPHDISFVKKIFILNILFFSLNFILNTYKSLFVGIQKGKLAEQSIAVNQIFFLFILIIFTFLNKNISNESKLYLVSLVNGFVCLLVNLIYTLYFFKSEKLSIFTKEKISKPHLKEIYSLGLKYMIIQIGTLFIFSSDSYILAYFFEPKEIASYEIVSKYFQFPLMILTATMAPLWSLFAIKFLEKNINWIKIAFKKFNYSYILVVLGIFICVILADPLMKVWISKDFFVSKTLIISTAILISLRIFTTFYSYFFNGIGNLRTYLFLLLISVILKIPLSYLFIKLNFGVSSVVLASIVCLLFWCIIQPIEANKILNNKF